LEVETGAEPEIVEAVGTTEGMGIVESSSGSEASPRNSAIPYNGASIRVEVSASPPQQKESRQESTL